MWEELQLERCPDLQLRNSTCCREGNEEKETKRTCPSSSSSNLLTSGGFPVEQTQPETREPGGHGPHWSTLWAIKQDGEGQAERVMG